MIFDSVYSGDDKFTTAEADHARRDNMNENQQVIYSPQEQERWRKRKQTELFVCGSKAPGTDDEMMTCEQIRLVFFLAAQAK